MLESVGALSARVCRRRRRPQRVGEGFEDHAVTDWPDSVSSKLPVHYSSRRLLLRIKHPGVVPPSV